MSYPKWRHAVEQCYYALASLFAELPDIDEWRYRAAFNDRQTPQQAARSIIEANGFHP